ncbi:MAG: S-methyl-5-thioribose-1-phosphate isomerase [Candidatus Kapaibacterium sp.]
MLVNGTHFRTIWENTTDNSIIEIIDQRLLPHRFEVVQLRRVDDFARAIYEMYVRGAPLIGAAAAYGMYVAAIENRRAQDFDYAVESAGEKLIATRPTAINLAWAVRRQIDAMKSRDGIDAKIEAALAGARAIAGEDVEFCKSIGRHGAEIIKKIASRKRGPVNILTHCNAGWLATVDWGTATAPIYTAHKAGVDLHVWVDETRPRSQGAKLTAWELDQEGVPNDLVVDNTGGHLMQHGMVDMCIVGSDRTTFTGDVGNKIGTYLKALAARDNGVPFYAALPSSTIDWEIRDGVRGIPIEQRDPAEVLYMDGLDSGELRSVRIAGETTSAVNYAFDVTPARLVTGIITERGVCPASEEGILGLFPEKRNG